MVASKWTILALTCAVAFGSYYSFETPSVLHNAMSRHYGFTDKGEFELYFSLIYSLYALPNTVIPLIGGWLSDQFGNKTIMLFFASFVLLGSVIETVACFRRSMELFLLGRFVFGCGAETLNVCCSILISKWFKGQELALSLAINLSLSKLATVVTDWTSPLMYRQIGIENNACLVTSLCLLCYLLTIVLLWLDAEDVHVSETGHHIVRDEEECRKLINHYHCKSTDDIQMMHLHPHWGTVRSYVHGAGVHSSFHDHDLTNQMLHHDGTDLEHTIESDITPLVSKVSVANTAANTTSNNLPIKIAGSSDVPAVAHNNACHHFSTIPLEPLLTPHPAALPQFLGFSLPVWLLFVFTFMMYGTFIPFTNWSNVILIQFYFTKPNPSAAYRASSEILAARLQSIPNFLSVFLTPVFGVSVDYYGYRTALLTSSAALLVVAHSIIYFQLWAQPVLPLVLMGLAFSIFGSVIWPCVPVVVHPQQQGTAYGIMTSFQNAGQFVMPLILQQIFRQSNNFGPCEGFFIVSSTLGVVVAALIWLADERMNHAVLRLPDTTIVVPPPHQDANGVHSHNHLHFADLPMEVYRDRHGKHLYQYGSLEEVHHSPGSERIQIPGPHLSTSSAISNASSLSSSSQNILSGSPSSTHGMLSARSFEGQSGADQQQRMEKSEVPLLGVSKFALLRSYSMPASHGSVSKDLCALAEQDSTDALADRGSGNGFQRSQYAGTSYSSSFIPQGQGSIASQQGSGSSQSSSPSDIRPMVIVPIPSVVHHSQEYYDRANAFQFPREDPLALRRQISENNRTQAQPYWLGIAQSAPANPGQTSQMEEYQKYRQEQVQLHNQLPPALQQEQLVLAPPRRAVRSIL